MPQLSQTFIDALPDLTLIVRRDGVIVGNLGGRDMGLSAQAGTLTGSNLAELWNEQIALDLKKLVLRTLKSRAPVERQFTHAERRYVARIKPQGVDRVMMIVSKSIVVPDADNDGPEDSAAEDCSDFAKLLRKSVANARLRESRLALGVIHLDGLRELKWATGAATADKLVSDLICRIAKIERTTLCSRQEDDLVAVLWDEIPGHDAAGLLAERARVLAGEPLEGTSLSLTPTVGVAFYPGDGRDSKSLLQSARAAALSGQTTGRNNTVNFCSDTVPVRIISRPDFENELRWALERDQFEIAYLPVIALAGRHAVAIEPVLRWNHPVCGRVGPERFRPALEAAGLSVELDRWMLRRACKDLAELIAAGKDAMNLAIKLGKQFTDSDTLHDEIAAALTGAGVHPSRLHLEIDLRSLAGSGRARGRFRELRQRGVLIHIDEFGAEAVPLARLGHLPIDGLKIGRSFVSRMEHDVSARGVCKSVMAVGHAFGLQSTATGVETRAQLDFLTEHRCDRAQGPLFGAPGTAQEAARDAGV